MVKSAHFNMDRKDKAIRHVSDMWPISLSLSEELPTPSKKTVSRSLFDVCVLWKKLKKLTILF